jgi:cell division protein FtsI (penicillin-binding protein 3)
MFSSRGWKKDFRIINDVMHIIGKDSAGKSDWASVSKEDNTGASRTLTVLQNVMPSVDGMGLKDALFLLENMKLKVVAKGKGKVKSQSIGPGTPIEKGQTVYLEMGMPL